MRSFVLNGTINHRRIKQLMKYIEVSKSQNINIYMDTMGGDIVMADVFIDFTHRTKKKLTFIAIGKIASAGVSLFIKSKGKKSLYGYVVAGLHIGDFSASSKDLNNKNSFDYVYTEEMKKENEDEVKLYADIFDLTLNEQKLLRDGGDLALPHDRLKKALPQINTFTWKTHEETY